MTHRPSGSNPKRAPDDDDWETDGDWDTTPRTDRTNDDDGFEDRYGDSRRTRAGRRQTAPDDNTPLILSLIGWFVCGILSLVALPMGIMQIHKARQRGDSAPGVAVAAVIISGLHIVVMLGAIAFFIVVGSL